MTITKTFAPWSPTVLSVWHEHLSFFNNPYRFSYITSNPIWEIKWANYLPNDEMASLLHHWGSDFGMRRAWESIEALNAAPTNDIAFFICHSAITHLAYFRSAPRRTKTERIKYFAKIAQNARDLSTQILGCIELDKIKISDFVEPACLERLAHNVVTVSYGPDVDLATKGLRGRYSESATKRALDMSLPNMVYILQLIAERATEKGKLPPMPSGGPSSDPEIKYLIEVLSDLLAKKFGAPQDKIVEAFVQVIYGDSLAISEDRVRMTRQRAWQTHPT